MSDGFLLKPVLLAGLLLLAAGGALAETLRDPMRPPDSVRRDISQGAVQDSANEDNGWRLSWTLVAEGRRVARLNDRLVRAGDELNGGRVVAIAAGSVTLEVEGETFEVRQGPVPGFRSTPAGKDGDS